jgi:hypothetical protein
VEQAIVLVPEFRNFAGKQEQQDTLHGQEAIYLKISKTVIK